MHAQSRNSESDVSSYIGLKDDGTIETNGIGMKLNKHLLESVVRNYFATNKLDYSFIYRDYYNEMSYLFEEYNTSPAIQKKPLITAIVKRFRSLKLK